MLFLLVAFQLVPVFSYGQSPELMSYQAIVRDGKGQLVVNQQVSVRISILQGSGNGTSVYTETQKPTTNANGLVSVEIGSGPGFDAIDWSNGSYFIKTETDPTGGTNYSIAGVSQLLSVPYALHAKTVEIDRVDDADADPTNEIQTLSLSGTNLTLSKNGGTVTLPSSGGGDNWGTQNVTTDATLSGSGTSTAPLKIADNGVTLSKIASSAVVTDKLADGAVTAGKVGNGAISSEKLADGAVITSKIADGAVAGAKIAQQSAANGQVLKWNGATWAPGNDEKGTSGLSLPYSQSGSFGDEAFSLTNSGSTAIKGIGFETGVYGMATATDKQSYGVFGENASQSGCGIYGYNSSPTGETVGVSGKSFSNSGIGVLGVASGCGLKGFSQSGIGVLAESETIGMMSSAYSSSGEAVGLVASTQSTEGMAVVAKASSSTGHSTGLYASNLSDQGTAIQGFSKASKGAGIGVWGRTNSPDGYSGYFTGGQFYVDNKIGIGIEKPENAIDIVKDYASIRLKSMQAGTSLVFDQAKDDTQYHFSWLFFEREGIIKFHFGMIGSQLQMYTDDYKGLCVNQDGNVRVNHLLTLDEGGKIGIGTNAPEYDIDINKSEYSSLRLKSATDGVAIVLDQVNNANNKYSWILYKMGGELSFMTGLIYHDYCIMNKDNKGLYVQSSGDVRLSENLWMDEGKRIGIGTTSPGAAIHVKGSGFPDSFIFLEGDKGNDAGFRLYEADVTKWHIYNNAAAGGLNICNANFTTAIFCKQSNSYVGINTMNPNYTLEVNGTAGKVGGGSWSTSSDIRLKNVKGNYVKGLNEILALRPITFTYKEGNARKLPTDQQQIGFVAQEVQKVFPEAVTEAADGYLDFNMHSINVAMVNAIKELKAENDELKARLDKLERLMEANGIK